MLIHSGLFRTIGRAPSGWEVIGSGARNLVVASCLNEDLGWEERTSFTQKARRMQKLGSQLKVISISIILSSQRFPALNHGSCNPKWKSNEIYIAFIMKRSTSIDEISSSGILIETIKHFSFHDFFIISPTNTRSWKWNSKFILVKGSNTKGIWNIDYLKDLTIFRLLPSQEGPITWRKRRT